MKKICAKTKNAFTLIEITLALGVVGVGVVSIMALFPAASSASRDAIGYTHAADSADNFLQLVKKRAEETSWGFIDNMPDENSVDDEAADSTHPVPTGGGMAGSRGTVHAIDASGGLYQVLSFNDGDLSDDTVDSDAIVDFNGVAKIWKDDSPALPSGNRDIGVLLNVELSWPAQRPYAQREKELYVMELFNR